MAKHKRKHHSKRHHSMEHGHDMHPAIGEHKKMGAASYSIEHGGTHRGMRVMNTNNGNRGPVHEDFSRPCGLPYGAIQRDLGNGDYYSMNGYRVGDLYEQVDKNMREDAAGLKSMTKPTNW